MQTAPSLQFKVVFSTHIRIWEDVRAPFSVVHEVMLVIIGIKKCAAALVKVTSAAAQTLTGATSPPFWTPEKVGTSPKGGHVD